MKALLKDKWAWILFCGSVILCWLFVGQYGIFGSKVDWVSQHSVLPDYFRQRFYETGDLFPDFAWNLGGGQNIYNFAYYGLFNPVLLCSYLLPFVKMDVYIMVSSILCYGISVVLFYFWLAGRNFSRCTQAGTAAMFALAAPLIYHSYNQLMFVNYMPFLCLALLGTDRYFRQKRSGMLLIGVCGMIFSSFYFSIGGMAVLCIYAFGEYLWMEDLRRGSLIRFGKRGGAFAGNLFLAVLLAGILLVPSFLSICAGRQEDIQTEITVKAAAFKPERFFYSAYGIGLTTFGLVCLIAGVICYEKWRERWNSLCILIVFMVPLFGYLLNGGLYDKDKVFIPFLPLICLEIGRYSSRLPNQGKGRLKPYLPYVFVIILVCVERNYGAFTKYWPLVLVDSCLMLLLFWICRRYSGRPWPLLASCVILFAYGWYMNWHQDTMISREDYEQIQDSELADSIRQVLEEDSSLYRLDVVGNGTENKNNLNRIFQIGQNITSVYSSAYNDDYRRFRNDIFKLNVPFRNYMMQSASDNPFFLRFMGVKYLAARRAPEGYRLLREGGNYNIYGSESAAPAVYVTDQVMGEQEYFDLNFPDNQTALLQNAIIPGESGKAAGEQKRMKACELTVPLTETETLSIEQTEDGYLIRAKKETEVEAELLGTEEQDTLLALSFDVENQKPNKDMFVRVQGQTNRLSAENHEYANHNTEFTYAVTLPDNGQQLTDSGAETDGIQDAANPAGARSVQLKFGPGEYKIKNIKAFSGTIGELENPKLYENPVRIRREDIKGDKLTGSVSASVDGYLITSLPYDENFTIRIDGEKTEVLRVNTAFTGARITAGEHQIALEYSAPGKGLGMLLSILGIAILLARRIFLKN